MVVFLNHTLYENTMKFEAVLVYHVSHFLFCCCTGVLLEVILSDHSKLMKSAWMGLRVGCKPTPAVIQLFVAKAPEAPFENLYRTTIGWWQNLWLQNTAFQPQKLAAFLGTISYILQTSEDILQIMNFSNPTCCAQR